jgi:tRNA(fMet)-specific endonuclease VapC
MTYLLDTNACIALINGAPSGVRRRLQRAIGDDRTVGVSAVVAFELWCGVAKSQHRDANEQRLDAFLAGPLEWVPFDEDDAREAGAVRAELEEAGAPIGAYDVLIAGQARRRPAPLDATKRRQFSRVSGR